MAKKVKQVHYDAKKHIKMTESLDRVMNAGFYLFITLFSIICLIPFLLVLGSSFTAERALTQNGYNIWPSEFFARMHISSYLQWRYSAGISGNSRNYVVGNISLNGIYLWSSLCNVGKEL